MQYLPLDQVNASIDDSNFKGIKLTIKWPSQASDLCTKLIGLTREKTATVTFDFLKYHSFWM